MKTTTRAANINLWLAGFPAASSELLAYDVVTLAFTCLVDVLENNLFDLFSDSFIISPVCCCSEFWFARM